MIGGPPIRDMAATLLARRVDLSNIPAAIMCLINAHYDARVVQLNLDRTIELARFDATVGAVVEAMRDDHAAAQTSGV